MIVEGLIRGLSEFDVFLTWRLNQGASKEGATLHEVFIKRSVMEILEEIQGDLGYLGYWDRNEFNDWIQAYKTLDRR